MRTVCAECGESFETQEGVIKGCPRCLRLTPSEIKLLREQSRLASAQMRGVFVDLFEAADGE